MPADAFWSATLYDTGQGFFIPNDQFKYSVGENAGFKLDEDGGIRIVIAAEQPDGVPAEKNPQFLLNFMHWLVELIPQK